MMVSWTLFSSPDIIETLKRAKDMGWEDNKVQVRAYQTTEGFWEFHIEPYEEDCNCSHLIRYDPNFDWSLLDQPI